MICQAYRDHPWVSDWSWWMVVIGVAKKSSNFIKQNTEVGEMALPETAEGMSRNDTILRKKKRLVILLVERGISALCLSQYP